MMQPQRPNRSWISSIRSLLVFSSALMTTWTSASSSTDLKVCDTYNVQLQATFPDQTYIPCSERETRIIEALLHALVQVDVIVGLDGGLPIRNFFLAFSTFGDNVTEWESYNETDFMSGSQYQLSQPHLTTEDILEDLYYEYTTSNEQDDTVTTVPPDTSVPTTDFLGTLVSSETNSISPTDTDTVAPSVAYSSLTTDVQANVVESDKSGMTTGSYAKKMSVEPPPPIELFDGSLRDGSKHMFPCANGSCGKHSLDATGCDADWCGWFFTEPCDAINHGPMERTPQFQAMMKRFQERVAEAIEKKLRKWTRDTDCRCLGNSWELKALVRRLG